MSNLKTVKPKARRNTPPTIDTSDIPQSLMEVQKKYPSLGNLLIDLRRKYVK